MRERRDGLRGVTRLMFRLLPVQILLAGVGAVNGIVSSFFASNYVGVAAMSAVGLYSPVNMLFNAISTMLVGGSAILCGTYMGRNEQEKMRNAFSLDLLLAALISVVFVVLFLVLGVFDLTGFMTRDEAVRPLFNQYLLGQAIGVFPLVVGNQLASFLAMENRSRRTTTASVVYIAVNLALNFLFVQVLRLEAFGLALASALGLWVFFGVQAQYFLSGKSHLRFTLRHLRWGDSGRIIKIGVPGALNFGYQTVRGLLVNNMILLFVGSVGISAFAAADNLLRIFWAVPFGMVAVSRLLMSVSIGEEDRQTLCDIMRVALWRYFPLMCVISAGLILCAVPLTRIFYHDPADPVFGMTVRGLRILPICMPLSVIVIHFTASGQAFGKQGFVHTMSLLDGIVCVAGFTALLIRALGMDSVYIANVLNGVVTTLVIVGYAWLMNRRFPRRMDELMVVPADFGAPESERLDLTVRSVEEVTEISRRVQTFCLARGVDARRAYLAALCLEEMAGNVVEHGFVKDRKPHSVDVRVVHKNDDVILRVRDDCVPFDPGERQRLAEGDDITKNIGIRTVFRMAREVQYQNILGLNVLTMRI